MNTNPPTPEEGAAKLEAFGTGQGVRDVVPGLYDELRMLAERQLALERSGHTLSPTALIHEAYVRLARDGKVTEQGRAYFFAAAARAMRQVLVDYARRRNRLKRGGGLEAVTLQSSLLGDAGSELSVLALHEALEELAEVAPRPAEVVELRFFGGLTVEETALALEVTPRTVKRDWAAARAWLYRRLEEEHT